VDPFRDELAAAHAKIAQLEERGRDLENALAEAHQTAHSAAQPEPSTSSEPSTSRSGPSLVLVFFLTLFIFGAAAAIFISIGSRTRLDATDFKGVATAESADPYHWHPPTLPREAFAPGPSGTASAQTCNCQPGDPLCSCL
jgi:hypothetical protein